jgi:DNA-binding CsgD family transcriptional regulator/N-acetylneuraminic acid mutarotase
MIDDLPPLSERELEVLKLVATGATNQQIARDLVISPNTVKVHLRNIFEKLGVQSRTEATTEAIRRGWVKVEGAVIVGAEFGEGGEMAAQPPEEPEPLAPPAPPIALWQRIYMSVAAGAILLALFLPGWWQSRGATQLASALSDAGRPHVAVAARGDLPRWTVRAPLPEGRSRLAVVGTNGKLYAIGGETASGITDQVTVYDPASNGWLPGAAKPTAVSNIGAAVLGGRVYVPGGVTEPRPDGKTNGGDAAGLAASPFSSPLTPVQNHQVTSVLEVYDPKTDTWTAGAALPEPRAAYALAMLNGRLYLFGGWDGAKYRAETFIYDPAANAWSTGTPLPAPRAFMAAAALQNEIFVVGGYDGQRELDTVTTYDPTGEGAAGGPWSTKPSLNQPRAGLGLLSLANRLYAIGGGWQSPLTFNEQYDMVSGGWSRTESPVTEQWRNLGLAALGEKIYAVGGWGGDYLPTNEEYLAIYRVLMPVGGIAP